MQIQEAGCATEALSLIEAQPPQVALLDVNLPGTHGLDLARLIRARDRKIKIVMVAGEADSWTVNEAMHAGASDFVSKTNTSDALPEVLRAVLTGGTFLCPDSQAALRRVETHSDVPPEAPGPAVLSTREREILRYITHGENTKTIAAFLNISPKTVETHRQHITRKLGTNYAAALVRYAIRHGLTHL